MISKRNISIIVASSILLFAVHARAGLDVTSSPSLSGYAKTTDIPPLCGNVPPADTLMGSTGTQTPCIPRPDASRPTIVQAAVVTTDASGTWSVTWAKPFNTTTPFVNPQPMNSGSLPITCNPVIGTQTSATGKCWQTVTMTLPGLATALLGLVLNPTTNAAAGTQIRLAGRDVTQ